MKGKEMKKNSPIDEEMPEICDRVRQIRTILFNKNNREFATQIGENEQIVSAICVGRRTAGMTTVVKIVKNLPTINAKWLLTGIGDMIIDRFAKLQVESVEASKDDSTVVQMLRDMLREKESKIEELIADNAQLRQQLRNLLCKEDATVESQEQRTSTETEIFTI